jgi:hypothetical protein
MIPTTGTMGPTQICSITAQINNNIKLLAYFIWGLALPSGSNLPSMAHSPTIKVSI